MIRFLIEFCCVVLLLTPFWELYDDRNGDDHKAKNDDWVLRGLLMVLSSVAVWFIGYHWELHNHNFFQAFILSFTMFAVFFPYLVNMVLYKRGVISDPKWWSHLSKTAIPDKWIYFIHWIPRMIMYLIILALGIRLYTCWDFTAWNSCQ